MDGHCLCGAVTVTAPDTPTIHACHCGMCRRWGGGALLGVHVGPEIQIEGRANLTTFSSSPWAERAFCSTCGTHIYYRVKPLAAAPQGEYVVPAGLLEGAELRIEQQIFVDRRPPYYAFTVETPQLTEAEVFAKYAPK